MLRSESSNPLPPFPSLRARLLLLAKKRQDDTPTSDVHAAFKEGERAPVARASE